jgi:hypothetical protein
MGICDLSWLADWVYWNRPTAVFDSARFLLETDALNL